MTPHDIDLAARLRTLRAGLIIRTMPAAPSAAGLALSWEAQGFLAGTPPHVAPAMLAVDRRVCRGLSCPSCRRLGMGFQPFHNPVTGRYRVLAVCPNCSAAEEV
jgi:hypothetical protein